ncbi:hypothetical protein BGY98DRAFT_1045182, partial [Russula aff. rugulosa BPL654]
RVLGAPQLPRPRCSDAVTGGNDIPEGLTGECVSDVPPPDVLLPLIAESSLTRGRTSGRTSSKSVSLTCTVSASCNHHRPELTLRGAQITRSLSEARALADASRKGASSRRRRPSASNCYAVASRRTVVVVGIVRMQIRFSEQYDSILPALTSRDPNRWRCIHYCCAW